MIQGLKNTCPEDLGFHTTTERSVSDWYTKQSFWYQRVCYWWAWKHCSIQWKRGDECHFANYVQLDKM